MEENSSISFWKLAVGLLATVILIGVVFLLVRMGKKSVNDSIVKITDAMAEYQDEKYTSYNGATVTGSEVETLVKSVLNGSETMAVRVITNKDKANNKSVDYKYNLDATKGTNAAVITDGGVKSYSFTSLDDSYINPAGSFKGEVYRDANGVLVAVVFTQQ